jgi:hypothetical protein
VAGERHREAHEADAESSQQEMTPTFEYVAILVPIAFVASYCAVQSTANFRERRYALGAAGLICALLAFAMLVIEAYNAALLLGLLPTVRIGQAITGI